MPPPTKSNKHKISFFIIPIINLLLARNLTANIGIIIRIGRAFEAKNTFQNLTKTK